mmetsp:Transcript_51145/g.112079  ORF Transcript_51145/g.112079 Transcript_51145/m.112079 type:complete len:226 (+) Transcript_51145:92-769(+)
MTVTPGRVSSLAAPDDDRQSLREGAGETRRRGATAKAPSVGRGPLLGSTLLSSLAEATPDTVSGRFSGQQDGRHRSVVDPLPPHRREEIEMAIRYFDQQDRGRLNYREFTDLLVSFGVHPAQVVDIIARVDPGRTESVTADHVVEAVGQFVPAFSAEEILLQACQACDADGTGVVATADLESVLQRMGTGVRLSNDEIKDGMRPFLERHDTMVRYGDFVRGLFAG